jgi:hypothetical protein
MLSKSIVAGAALIMALAPTFAVADTVESVEGARAKERQGRWLNHENRESLRRWGGNDDYGRYDYGRYERDYYDGYDHGSVRYYRAYPR